jgi:vacuolar-type H+-ATPase subunit I/STV1
MISQAPAYLSEMSAPHLRGIMVSLKEAAIVLGILVGQAFGFALDHQVGLMMMME